MATKKSSKILILVAVVVVVVVAAVIAVTQLSRTDSTIVIGVVGARTGDNAALGEKQGNGALLAAEEINANGGVRGAKISLVLEDSQGLPAQAVACLDKLIYRENVVAVIGDCQSSPVLAMMPVIAKAQIPLLAHGTSLSITQQNNPWVFRTRANDVVKFSALVDLLVDQMNYSRIAVFHDSADYGMGGADAIIGGLAGRNMEVVANESWTPGDKDFSSQLINIRSSNPEVVVFIGPMVDMGLAMKQARQVGIEAQFAGGAGIEGETTVSAAAGAAEGLVFCAGFISSNPDPKVQSFVTSFEEHYGYKPDDFAATGYDAIYLLAEAIEKAGSTEPADIREALANLEYQGVEGTFEFDSVGEGLHTMAYGKVVNGVPTYFDPSNQ
jgi:branched-chain amino acid transport system substrate-binding protein